jgi:excisionase family DNA binding protein
LTIENRNLAPITEKRVYTVAEAAALLEISTNTMYKLVKENHFSIRKVGRDIRISKISFDEWIDRQVQH